LLEALESMLLVYESLKAGEQEWTHYDQDAEDARGVIAEHRSKNVYWRDLPGGAEVEMRGKAYVSDGAVVFWHGHEAREAQKYLDAQVKATEERWDREAREQVEKELFEAGIIEDPDMDGGLLG
jgi:hypothetical protein